MPFTDRGVRGTALLRTPTSWRRTSEPGAQPATFGPIRISSTCRVHVAAFTIVTDASMLESSLVGGNGVAETLGRGDDPARPWRLLGLDARFALQATGLRRLTAGRYAGLRVTATHSPGCSAAERRRPEVATALRTAARRVTTSTRGR